MRIFSLALGALMLASCSPAANVFLPLDRQGVQNAAVPAQSAYAVLYRFPGSPSGSKPAGLMLYDNSLYGTTTAGGSKTLGTIFVRGSGGRVRELYDFRGGADGAEPEGNLVPLNGALYGTTEYGGPRGDGTIFTVSPAGRERAIYAFEGDSDGANPLFATLIASNGKLYGTTSAGGDPSCSGYGSVGCGTVFEVTPSGSEHVLYRFKGKPDGSNPAGGLVEYGGNFYGTTSYGGKFDSGSVYELTPSGAEHTIYSFKGYPDGGAPFAGLTVVDGTFYGTTTLGGAYQDAGTVFALTPSGTERVLHSFRGAPDGALPFAPLVEASGKLYGTTEDGGSSELQCVGHGVLGCGTVFSIGTSGGLTILYRFRGHLDGSEPWAGLVSRGSVLYGVTLVGGDEQNGIVFQIAP